LRACGHALYGVLECLHQTLVAQYAQRALGLVQERDLRGEGGEEAETRLAELARAEDVQLHVRHERGAPFVVVLIPARCKTVSHRAGGARGRAHQSGAVMDCLQELSSASRSSRSRTRRSIAHICRPCAATCAKRGARQGSAETSRPQASCGEQSPPLQLRTSAQLPARGSFRARPATYRYCVVAVSVSQRRKRLRRDGGRDTLPRCWHAPALALRVGRVVPESGGVVSERAQRASCAQKGLPQSSQPETSSRVSPRAAHETLRQTRTSFVTDCCSAARPSAIARSGSPAASCASLR